MQSLPKRQLHGESCEGTGDEAYTTMEPLPTRRQVRSRTFGAINDASLPCCGTAVNDADSMLGVPLHVLAGPTCAMNSVKEPATEARTDVPA